MNNRERPQLASNVRLQIDPVRNAPVLLYPEGLIELNETAHELTKRFDGRSSLHEIVNALAGEYEVSPEEIEQDASDFVAELMRHNLIVMKP